MVTLLVRAVSFLSLWLINSTLLSAVEVKTREKITVVTSEFPPYSSQHLVHQGYVNHVIECAFSKVNRDVKFLYVPWSRAYQMVAEGKYPATSYWYEDPKHYQNFLLSNPIMKEDVIFVRRKSQQSKIWRNLESFEGLRIGMTRGYTYTDELWQFADKNRFYISIVNTDRQNVEMLIADRVDLFPYDKAALEYLLLNHHDAEVRQKLEFMEPPLANKIGHVLFSKRHPDVQELRLQFNTGLKACYEQGILQSIHDRFHDGHYSSPAQTYHVDTPEFQ